MADAERSAEQMTAWLREAADEIDKAHAYLDSLGVPRINPAPDGAEFSLAARIAYAAGVRGSPRQDGEA